MAPGLLPSRRSRSSRCVLCLAVTAAAVLGPASWTYAAERAPGGVPHRQAGAPSGDATARGPLPLAPRSAGLPDTATGSPTATPSPSPSPSPHRTTPPPSPVPASRPPSASPSVAPSASPSAVPSGSPSALPSDASGSARPPSGSAAPPAGSSAGPSASA
ncbi:hypothetical protein ACTU45_29035, partial [Streptomyces sp. 24-1644]